MITIADNWLAQGAKKGGAEALRKAAEKVLRRRFKRVPAEIKSKLATASSKTLETWILRAMDAKTIDAVFKTH